MGNLMINYYEATAMILFGIGLVTLLLHKNLIKKIIGLNIMDTSVFLYLAAKGYISGRVVPIVRLGENASQTQQFINPVPSGLVLTGIVVAVSVTAFALALCIKIYEHYGTLDLDKIALMDKEEA